MLKKRYNIPISRLIFKITEVPIEQRKMCHIFRFNLSGFQLTAIKMFSLPFPTGLKGRQCF